MIKGRWDWRIWICNQWATQSQCLVSCFGKVLQDNSPRIECSCKKVFIYLDLLNLISFGKTWYTIATFTGWVFSKEIIESRKFPVSSYSVINYHSVIVIGYRCRCTSGSDSNHKFNEKNYADSWFCSDCFRAKFSSSVR